MNEPFQIPDDTPPEDAFYLGAIAGRVSKLAEQSGQNIPKWQAARYVAVCHLHACPLKLRELFEAPEPAFTHDIMGLILHTNPVTGELDGSFWPKYAKAPQRAPRPLWPNPEQAAALLRFAAKHGPNWKTALHHCWTRASYGDIPASDSAFLQQVRNNLGPMWLAQVSLAEIRAAIR